MQVHHVLSLECAPCPAPWAWDTLLKAAVHGELLRWAAVQAQILELSRSKTLPPNALGSVHAWDASGCRCALIARGRRRRPRSLSCSSVARAAARGTVAATRASAWTTKRISCTASRLCKCRGMRGSCCRCDHGAARMIGQRACIDLLSPLTYHHALHA